MYSKAFQCAKCPQNGNETRGPACPMWWEIVLTDPTGEVKIEKNCGFALLPQFLVEVIKASNRSTANTNETLNAVMGMSLGFANLHATVTQAAELRRIEPGGSNGVNELDDQVKRAYRGEQPLLSDR